MSQRYNSERAGRGVITRRRLLGATATAMAVSGLTRTSSLAGAEPVATKVIVGAHPWVYAATQPKYDITPILPRIFADMQYAGIEGIELMHTALRPKDAVERIGELSQKHRLPVLGTSFGGAMWDRAQHTGRVEWASMGRNPGDAEVLDADLFPQQGDSLAEPVVFGLEADACVDRVGGPAAGVGDGELGQADHLQDGRLDGSGPAFG